MRLAIVGFGRFGQALGKLAADAGEQVIAYDPRAALTLTQEQQALRVPTLEAAVQGASAVVVATPVEAMPEVFRGIAAILDRTEHRPLVMDVASVKLAPIAAMNDAFGDRHRYIAAHPLFGPASLAAETKPLRVVVCPCASEATVVEAEWFWKKLGCETIRVEADEHDRVMARTQGLAFFLARGVLDAGFGEATPLAPPSYEGLARAIDAVRGDADHLFRAVGVSNPFATAVRARVLRALEAADAELARGASREADTIPPPPEAPNASADLGEARSLIDDIDAELMELLARRASLAKRIARVKESLGLPARDANRETQLLAAWRTRGEHAGLDADAVVELFGAVIRFSRAHQRKS